MLKKKKKFLNERMDEQFLLTTPTVATDTINHSQAIELVTALYGTKQAARMWYEEFKSKLESCKIDDQGFNAAWA